MTEIGTKRTTCDVRYLVANGVDRTWPLSWPTSDLYQRP